jgi:hypothetical protein
VDAAAEHEKKRRLGHCFNLLPPHLHYSNSRIEQTLRRFNYRALGRADRGVVLRYVERVSGYSRQTLTRLVAQYRDSGKLRRRQRTVAGFARYYTDADARLLAELDPLHATPCGVAAKKRRAGWDCGAILAQCRRWTGDGGCGRRGGGQTRRQGDPDRQQLRQGSIQWRHRPDNADR